MKKEIEDVVSRYYAKWTKHITPEMMDFINENTHFLDYKNPSLKERVYHILFDLKEEDKCVYCGKTLVFHNKLVKRKTSCCSSKCANSLNVDKIKESKKKCDKELIQERRKATCLEKYGVDHVWKDKEVRRKCKETNIERHGYVCNFQDKDFIEKSKKLKKERYGENFEGIQEKIKQTWLKKYGVENVFQDENIKDKIKQTFLEKYGETSFTQTAEFKEKSRKTCLERYGVEHGLQSKEIRDKVTKTCLERYGSEYPYKSKVLLEKSRKTYKMNFYDEFKRTLKNKNLELLSTKDEFINKKTYKFKCLLCDDEFYSEKSNSQGVVCLKCFKNSKSKAEVELKSFLKEYNVITNSRSIIPPLELDIYLPNFNIAIEYDGIYWHSDLFKDKNYHLNKTQMCKEKGIQLIHVFENEWIEKKEIVKSVILAKLKKFERRIPARKCKLKELSSSEYKQFCLDNHMQGWVPAKYKIGLFYNDELVQICSFGKNRFKKDEMELLRHCSKLNTQIIGGFSKLLKYFDFDNLVTYIDLRYSDGRGFEGWEYMSQSVPNYWYWSGRGLESRMKYQKHKLCDILESFDDDLSEYENMVNNGYMRIFDCGNLKLSYINKNRDLNKKEV